MRKDHLARAEHKIRMEKRRELQWARVSDMKYVEKRGKRSQEILNKKRAQNDE